MKPKTKRGPLPLHPDLDNRNPYRGLPADFPSTHSRFPIVPSQGVGDLSFDPAFVQNSRPEGLSFVVGPAERRAWRDAMQRALGGVVQPPPDDTDA